MSFSFTTAITISSRFTSGQENDASVLALSSAISTSAAFRCMSSSTIWVSKIWSLQSLLLCASFCCNLCSSFFLYPIVLFIQILLTSRTNTSSTIQKSSSKQTSFTRHMPSMEKRAPLIQNSTAKTGFEGHFQKQISQKLNKSLLSVINVFRTKFVSQTAKHFSKKNRLYCERIDGFPSDGKFYKSVDYSEPLTRLTLITMSIYTAENRKVKSISLNNFIFEQMCSIELCSFSHLYRKLVHWLRWFLVLLSALTSRNKTFESFSLSLIELLHHMMQHK